MSTFGFGNAVSSTEARIVVSVAIAFLAFSTAALIRELRRRLTDHFPAIAVDLIGSLLSILVVVAALIGVIDLWGQTETIAGQSGVTTLEDKAAQIAVSVVILVAVQVLTTVARRLLNDITQESDAMSEHERELTYRLVQITLWSIGFLVVLGVWEINLGGLLIGAGFLGIVVGLAARQTLASMLAGLVLMFSRPFEVGDWIAIGEGTQEAEGIVTDITLMNTRIQAFDGEFVMVPNEVVGSRMVKNRTRKGRLRMEVEVGVDYEADVERARELATEAVSEIDMIMQVPRAETVVKHFDDSSVTLGVRGWIEHPSSRRRWRARTRMIRGVKRRFAEEGIKIPFPQRELTGRAETSGFRLAPEQRTVSSEDGEPAREDATGDAEPARDPDPTDASTGDSGAESRMDARDAAGDDEQ